MPGPRRKFKVDIWSDTTGEEPRTITSIVIEAADEYDAVQLARDYVRTHHPEINPMKLDTWFTEEIFE